MIDVKGLTLSTASELIQSREHTSQEIAEAYLARIDRLNSGLNAYLKVFQNEALSRAAKMDAELESGKNRGPLHGIPVGLKDIMDIEGYPTTAGGVLLPESGAVQNAVVVDRLLNAGAVILGKLNLHEYAWGGTTNNPHYGSCYNPWKEGYSPGGSSGGSGAAVVAGLCAVALGTDTLGSIRIPSSYSGCVGLKPTNGLVSTRGVFPLSWSLDTVGPLARRVKDVRLVLRVLAGYDEEDPYSVKRQDRVNTSEGTLHLKGIRIGVIQDWALAFDGTPDEQTVAGIVSEAMDVLVDLGCERIELKVPEIQEATQAAFTITLADAAAIHKERLESSPDSIGEDVRSRLELGRALKGTDVAEAFRSGVLLRRRFGRLLEGIDCFVCPTTATTAHAFDAGKAASTAKYTAAFNLLGYPAVSVPCGFTEEGLPVGLMIVGGPYQEALALRVAEAYEGATPWKERLPSDALYDTTRKENMARGS